MIINISEGVFGGPLRNGDLIGVANVVAHLRKEKPEIKFHMKQGSVNSADYVQKFYQFMLEKTDYFSKEPGDADLAWRRVNLWDFRDIIGDNVIIPNNEPMEKKIVVCPIFDAPYNVYRNWPRHVFEEIIKKYSTDEYKDYQKIICIHDHFAKACEFEGWRYSTNFNQNLYHIMTAETFIGGDTGTSHFAWSLDRGPKNLIYYNSGRGLMHCLPFYLLEGKGKIVRYWLDLEGTTWQ